MSEKSGEKVLVALSGGVESMVVAWLLKKQGKQLRGVYFDLLEETSAKESILSLERKLGISIQLIECKAIFEQVLAEEIKESYLTGKKVEPKKVFHQKLLFPKIFDLKNQYQFQKVSTGHRVQMQDDPISSTMKVFRYTDAEQDETELLLGVSQADLQTLDLPLGTIPAGMMERIGNELGITNELARFDLDWNKFYQTVRKTVPKPREHAAEVFSVEGMKLGICADYAELTLGAPYEIPSGGEAFPSLPVIFEVDPAHRKVVVGSIAKRVVRELHFEDVSWFTQDDLKLDSLACSMVWGRQEKSFPVDLIQYEGGRVKGYFKAPLKGKDSNIFHGETVLWISGNEVLGGGRVMGSQV